MKAINTIYKDYLFRSRLEARWAIFFDEIGLVWEYEKEGFELFNGEKYLPDFYFPQLKFYGEIKSDDFILDKRHEKFVKESFMPLVIFDGLPWKCNYDMYFILAGDDIFDHTIDLKFNINPKEFGCTIEKNYYSVSKKNVNPFAYTLISQDTGLPIIASSIIHYGQSRKVNNAAIKAKRARFEFNI